MKQLSSQKQLSIVALLIISLLDFNAFAAEKPIKIGLIPYLSPEFLMTRYAPFFNHIREQLDRPVAVATAPNFATYVKRAHNKTYDLYATPPHFAALAEVKYGFKRIAKLSRKLDGAIVVHVDSPYTDINQLKGKIIATPDRLAIITILGELALQEHGIDPTKDVSFKNMITHNTALLEVIEKRTDAAVVSSAVYESMNPVQKKQLRLIFTTAHVPHMMILSSPNLNDETYENLKKAVLSFSANGAGKAFFKESGYIDMEAITEADMAKMKAMLPLLTPRLK